MPHPPGRPVRTRRRPAHFLETVQACRLATPNFAAPGSQSDRVAVSCRLDRSSVVAKLRSIASFPARVTMSYGDPRVKRAVAAATSNPQVRLLPAILLNRGVGWQLKLLQVATPMPRD